MQILLGHFGLQIPTTQERSAEASKKRPSLTCCSKEDLNKWKMEKLGDESGAPFAFYILRKRKGNHYRVVKALSWRNRGRTIQSILLSRLYVPGFSGQWAEGQIAKQQHLSIFFSIGRFRRKEEARGIRAKKRASKFLVFRASLALN